GASDGGSGSGGGSGSSSSGGGSDASDGGSSGGTGPADGVSSQPGGSGAGTLGGASANEIVLPCCGETISSDGRMAGTSMVYQTPDQNAGASASKHSFWIVTVDGKRTQIDLESLSRAKVAFTPDCSGYGTLYEQRPNMPGWVVYDLGYLTRGQTSQLSFLSGSSGTYTWYISICNSWSRPLKFNVL
ncbi:MAG TPA: hypothetical protein VN455_00140, partial [Methanotrichaceae archaeon]|nr:hypothetical protein [Methanotrichaceae archaeon]